MGQGSPMDQGRSEDKCAECSETFFTSEDNYDLACNRCHQYIHTECANMNITVLSYFKENNTQASYTCSLCINDKNCIENVNKKLENIESLLVFYDDKFKKYDKLLDEIHKNTGKPVYSFNSQHVKRSFAQTVLNCHDTPECSSPTTSSLETPLKKAKKSVILKQKPAIIVKPKDAAKSRDEIKKSIKSIVDPKIDPVSNLRETKDGNIIIECNSIESTADIQKKISDKIGESCIVEEIKKTKPAITIMNIESEVTEGELIDCICQQNDSLGINKEELEIVHFKKRKYSNIATVKMDWLSFTNVMECGYLNISWRRLKVSDALSVLRCYKCQDFGHSATNCTGELCCPVCAGEHDVKDCKCSTYKCINCCRANDTLNFPQPLDTNHAVWSEKCQVLGRKLEQKRNRTYRSQ